MTLFPLSAVGFVRNGLFDILLRQKRIATAIGFCAGKIKSPAFRPVDV